VSEGIAVAGRPGVARIGDVVIIAPGTSHAISDYGEEPYEVIAVIASRTRKSPGQSEQIPARPRPTCTSASGHAAAARVNADDLASAR
jgi:hypothetical protein